MSAQAAYQLIHDELNLDGNPALNLASSSPLGWSQRQIS